MDNRDLLSLSSHHGDPSHFLKRENILKSFVEDFKDFAFITLDTEGKISLWNPGASKLKGYSEDEVLGEHFSLFYLPEDVENGLPYRELLLALQNNRYEKEGWRIKKDGTKFWVNVILNSLKDEHGTHIGFMYVVRDLTEKRKADQIQRDEEEKFRLMVETVKDYAIFMLSETGHVITWNEGAKKFKGYKPHEIIGQHFSKFYLEEEVRAKKPEMELEIASRLGRFEDEGWRLRKDGTVFWANVIITALRNREGKLFGFSKVTRDLTERKKSEEELKLAYENLEQRIKEKTSLLEEALKMRDEFLSIASHELKTPVTSIKMQIQMAQHRLKITETGQIDVDKLNKSLAVTLGQIERLTQLVEDLLDISRIQAGKLSYTFEKVNFAAMLNEVLEGFSQQLVESRSEVKVYVDEELEGYWDRTRMEQVLVNLISNASKYAPGSPIIIFAKKQGEKALISVQDFGPGIPRQMRRKMFERFERLGQSRNVAGLGLGLFISKQIILAHGGTLELNSSEQKGANFMISIPFQVRSKPKQV